MYDLVRFARERGILCQGRGSAANSVVCFCLGVTSVDPDRIDVLFERFISKERNEAPDIDVDFEHERREEVLQYLFDRYGRERAGMTATVITYRPRSAIRDVGKALSLSNDRVDKLASQMEHVDRAEQMPQRMQEGGIDPESQLGRRMLELVTTLLGFPRHLSQHVGGMVMSRGPLCELVPIENAAMPGRTVIQWDKDDLDALGLLKVDCLSLGMLSCIRRAFQLIELHHDRQLSLATVPSEDPEVYEMVCQADTVGVFQIESRAQMSMLPRLKPRCFYDLVIEVAIVRPGPIQGIWCILICGAGPGKKTLNSPMPKYDRCCTRLWACRSFRNRPCGWLSSLPGLLPVKPISCVVRWEPGERPGDSEVSRKAGLGHDRASYDADFAERVFKQISGFGEYGFPESHAASFALLVYVSAWLKRYHPAAFCAALINSQPMGFYAPAQLVRDAREHGVTVQPIDVNASDWDCTLEPIDLARTRSTRRNEPTDHGEPAEPAMRFRFSHNDETVQLRLGFRLLNGLSDEDGRAIEEERRARGRFQSFEEFARRTRLPRATLQLLARSDAFASLGTGRRASLWKALPSRESLPLFETEVTGLNRASEDPLPQLPQMTPQEEVVADYLTAGVTLRKHPVSFLRESLTQLRAVTSEQLSFLEPDRRVKVAGLVLMRQRPATASGITFVTLEDETGIANLVIYPSVWQKFRKTARFASVLMATGRLQREGDIIHVVCDRLDDVSEMLNQLPGQSRDFR